MLGECPGSSRRAHVVSPIFASPARAKAVGSQQRTLDETSVKAAVARLLSRVYVDVLTFSTIPMKIAALKLGLPLAEIVALLQECTEANPETLTRQPSSPTAASSWMEVYKAILKSVATNNPEYAVKVAALLQEECLQQSDWEEFVRSTLEHFIREQCSCWLAAQELTTFAISGELLQQLGFDDKELVVLAPPTHSCRKFKHSLVPVLGPSLASNNYSSAIFSIQF